MNRLSTQSVHKRVLFASDDFYSDSQEYREKHQEQDSGRRSHTSNKSSSGPKGNYIFLWRLQYFLIRPKCILFKHC
ncbi:hypothetical protein FKM82_023482 [Ascaphus truei]